MWLDDGHVRVWLPCEWVMDAGVHVDRRKEEGAAATFRRSLLVRVAALVSRPRSIRLHFTPVPVPVPVPVLGPVGDGEIDLRRTGEAHACRGFARASAWRSVVATAPAPAARPAVPAPAHHARTLAKLRALPLLLGIPAGGPASCWF